MDDAQKVMTLGYYQPVIKDGLHDKTWPQLRQSTRIALAALRTLRDRPEAKNAIAAIEQVLAEGSTDPVT